MITVCTQVVRSESDTLDDGACVELCDSLRSLHSKNDCASGPFWICRKALIFPSLLFSLFVLLFCLWLDVWAGFSRYCDNHTLSTAANSTTPPRVMPSKVISGTVLVAARGPPSVLFWNYYFCGGWSSGRLNWLQVRIIYNHSALPNGNITNSLQPWLSIPMRILMRIDLF